MTAREYIDRADMIKPNAFGIGTKLLWLSDISAKVEITVHGKTAEQVSRLTEDDLDTDLDTVPFPFDCVFVDYLCARIDFENENYGNYANIARLVNEELGEYGAYAARGKQLL